MNIEMVEPFVMWNMGTNNNRTPTPIRQYLRVLLASLLGLFWLSANAAPIQHTIVISGSSSVDATFSDWTTLSGSSTPTVAADWGTITDVTNNSGQFSTDNQYEPTCATMADLDCSTTAAGVGRDLRKFSYTWDSANLYMYVERYASNSSANDWCFYLDTNNNGLMELNEPVLNVKWTGSNGKTVRQLWTYTPARAAGDPMTCPDDGGINTVTTGYCPVEGEGDGYDMPGTLVAGVTYSVLYGGATGGSGEADPFAPSALLDGVAMETFISWNDIDAAAGTSIGGPRSVGFHISSSNGENIPAQLDDNMNGLPGGAGGGIAFSDLAITKTASSATVVGGAQFTYTLTITNNGDSDATGIEVTDVLPAEVTYVADSDTTNTTLTGSTLVWNVAALANGASVALNITVTSAIVAANTTVSNIATITDQVQADTDLSNNSATYDILTLIPAPDLEITKSHVGDFSETANGSYTIGINNIGIGDETGTVTVTDTLPVGLTYVSGTGTNWVCNAIAQVVTCTNPGPLLSGNSLADIQIVATADIAAVPGVTNTATAVGDTHDNDLTNNTATDVTVVNAITNQQCYAVNNNNDILSLIKTSDILNATNNETDIGATGVTGIESVAYDCGTGVLFAANSGQLGTLNQFTGAFNALGNAGSSSNGSIGSNINFTNITGLAQDPVTSALYASVSRTATDVLIQINKATGAFVPNAFGDGIDYVTIGSIADVSDITVLAGGQLYGIDNGAGNLIIIDKTLGTTAIVGALGVANITGLGTDAISGLWGTTSTDVYEIDTATGAATNPRAIDGEGGASFGYGAFDCIANCVLKQAELAISKTVSNANPLVAATIVYTVTVTNNGSDTATAVQVSDTLPAGVSFVAPAVPSQGSYDDASGAWYIGTINSGASVTLQLSATVDAGTAGNTITNTASISYATQNDPNLANNSASVNIVPVNSNLSTSAKSGLDVNAGNLEVGDTIRYTITLTESAGADATNVNVTDTIPANTTNFTLISFPAGATDNSTAGTGPLDISNITVLAGTSETIVFDVTVAAGTANNTIIMNTATVSNPSGPGATPSSTPLVVTGGVETKTLYLQGANTLTRVQHATSTTTTIAKTVTTSWDLNPTLFSNMTLDNTLSLVIPTWIETTNNAGTVTAELSTINGTVIGTSTITPSKNMKLRYTFSFTPGATTINAGDGYRLSITNSTNKNIIVDTFNAGQYSQVDLISADVIKVNSVSFYDAAYPAGNLITAALPGDTIYIRALVQDPFGSFDITSASVQLVDALNNTVVAAATPMATIIDPGDGTKTFEYVSYTISGADPTGLWTALVTAEEGTEGIVRHTASGSITVRSSPSITVLKMSQVVSDPVNGVVNPKAIPGAFVNYTIIATNSGAGYADVDNTFIIDPIPASTNFFVNDLTGAGSGPVAFTPATSGLTYTLATDLFYSTVGSAGPWTLWSATPAVADANGINATVKAIRINPKGIFAAAGAGNKSFSLIFRVRVQ